MSHAPRFVFHLLPNAHLDPVWLWDWREGLNEGLITCRAVLNLMDEFPDLTFMRGESAIYEHIEKTDPAMFRRIREKIDEGRWDVVGGTVVQPDTNLACTEVLCREYERGLSYFKKHLKVRPTVAWQADSFGHTAGLPNVFSAFGIEGFSFTRPQKREFELQSPAFWWEGDWKNRILCYRQHFGAYCSERGNIHEVLDITLAGVNSPEEGGCLRNASVLMGLGNHGGGPTRRHLLEIQEWGARHPEVELRYNTLHGFFAELKREMEARATPEVPVLRGEFGYCLRGCYSSVQKFKSLYRLGEARIAEAELTRSVISTVTGGEVPGLDAAWSALTFNSFHDILPGTSIERALDDQLAWMGGALHQAQEARFDALNLLAAKVDTTVPPARQPDRPTDVPVLVWNPLARPYVGLAEVEVPLDHRPIWLFKNRPGELPVVAFDHLGKPAAFQVVDTEHGSMTDVPWRRRVLVPVKIPALGWTTVRVGWRDEPEAQPVKPVCTALGKGGLGISNGEWTVQARPGTGIHISRNGENLFGERDMEIRTLSDPWGSWGGMVEELDSYALGQVARVWKLERAEVLEAGPLRAKLWTRWTGANSWVDLTFSAAAGAPELKVEGRMLVNERSARIKLVFPCRGDVAVDVPAGKIARDAVGNVPMGRWVTRTRDGRTFGFASDVLSDCDATPDELGVTLARASRYANDVNTGPEEKMWQPAVDCGELKFQFCLFTEAENPDHAAETLLFPPTGMVVSATPGPWKSQGGLGQLEPSFMRLLSLEKSGPGRLKIRLQNRAENPAIAVMHFEGSAVALGNVRPQEIRTLVLKRNAEGQWTAQGTGAKKKRAAVAVTA